MRRFQALNNPLIWVIGGAMISTWLFGVFHTYREHGAVPGFAALLLPPYGLYMAVEQSVAHSIGAGPVFSLPVAEMIETGAAACRESDSIRHQVGLSVERFGIFCTCVWQFVFENFPPGENDYVDKFGKNSTELESIKSRAANSCVVEAKNRGTAVGK